ncbi:lantibiotic dehydratase [Plantactinospora sp. CA-290183]|uniref:lantibiotic dehydratase n=1 Tax=Plantactinospora sp. CA-290183 TaxID=3240006 RepID=UPI003D93910F
MTATGAYGTGDELVTAEVSIGRLASLPAHYPMPVPPDDPDDQDAVLTFLRAVAADSVLAEAITVSSPSLARTLRDVTEARRLKPAKLRRACFATMSYLSRATHRTTPFGLLAGVCRVELGDEPKIRIGTEHTKFAYADYGWLAGLVRTLRTDPVVLPTLALVANELSEVRDGRFVLAYLPVDDAQAKNRDLERTVRRTRATALAMASARTPIRYPDLLAVLRSEFPDVEPAVIARAIAGLVESEFLLTDLLPAVTTVDSLRHILDRLPPEHPVRGELTELDERIREYAGTGIGGGRDSWRDTTSRASSLHGAENVLQVDLRVDADITLPRELGADVAAAVAIAWRLQDATTDAASAMAPYRIAAVERYGAGRLVPLRELLDPITGLGLPDHYEGHHHDADGSKRRDRALVALAQEAAFTGQREVLLDEALVARLARRDGRPGPSESAEVLAEVLADDDEALRTGNYRMVLTNTGNRPGAMFGRFLDAVGELADPVARRLHDLHTAAPDGTAAVPAQVCVPPGASRSFNVLRTPLLAGRAISIGGGLGFPGPGTTVSTLDDLAIAAHHDRMEVHCTRTGTELVPFAPHALNPAMLPPAARLLLDIGAQWAPPIMPWYWGAAASALPYLPRVRYGRVVLSSARWIPDASLLGSDLSWERWRARWQEWKDRWRVPDVVCLTSADHRLRADVRREADLRMVRAELDRKPGTAIHEEPAGGEYGRGWSAGHANEIVFAVQGRPPGERQGERAESERQQGHRYRAAAACAAYPPGGEWLYLSVLCPAAAQNQILAAHLPELVGRAREVCDRWFFLRYAEDGRLSLRIRFHGDPGDLNGKLLPSAHAWLSGLRAAHLAEEMILGTYRPEIGRYGGPDAIEAAEHAFTADSELAVELTTLLLDGRLDVPRELLAAANHLDLVRTLAPDDWNTWLVEAYPKDDRYHKVFQAHRRRVLELLDPADDWAALRAVPGGERLRDAWRRRAPRVAAYGRLIRDMVADGRLAPQRTEFSSLLHLSHNRHTGTDRDVESSTYAVLRAFAQARLDKDRHLA